MFSKLLSAVFALAALALVSSNASAQGPEWDRRISDIRIVHPPGTPPGYVDVTFDIGLMSGPLAPSPLNLSVDVVVTLNGMPFAARTLSATAGVNEVIACFPAPTCPDLDCNVWFVDTNGITVNNNAHCSGNFVPQWGCRCWSGWDAPWTFGMVVGPGDVIGIGITPAAGSLPEIHTSDDSMSLRVGDQLPGTDFCFGDGSVVACPCANSGLPGNGCANSLNAAGAYLGATGTASVSADSVVLTGSGMPNSACLYFQGTTQLAGTPFGDGLRCAGGAVTRLGIKNNAAGTSSYPVGADLPVSIKGGVGAAGGNRTYQAWYRNAGAFCTASTFNLTNGTAITWSP